jgi:hypothetical protein
MKILTGVLFISWAMVFEKPKEGKQENEKQDSLAGAGEQAAHGAPPRAAPAWCRSARTEKGRHRPAKSRVLPGGVSAGVKSSPGVASVMWKKWRGKMEKYIRLCTPHQSQRQ